MLVLMIIISEGDYKTTDYETTGLKSEALAIGRGGRH
jgi:hypothetical protein